ncbi:hypothetical protein HI482_005078, partial [Escherichia coli]|nr:hypothetical protein [Escherichia coli]EHY7980898.1 hypothetical protein [Escherichia coli]
MYELYCMYCVFFIPGIRWRHSLRNRSQTMTSLSPDTVRRIEDAAAALIAAEVLTDLLVGRVRG